MTTMTITTVCVAGILAILLIALNERFNLLSQDRFPSLAHKAGAYLLLIGFLGGVAGLVALSSQAPPTAAELQKTPFWSLFMLHAILIVFLTCWWLLTGRPALGEFFSLRREEIGKQMLSGLAIGTGGWITTILVALTIGLAIQQFGGAGQEMKPPEAIRWMAGLAAWKKIAIVFSAMTFEELFFRGWLQKRVGLIASSAAFVIAHAGFGAPLMFIGISVVSLLIGFAFYRTKSLGPCIVAHGVFDAIQLFVILPVAVQMLPK
jgi:membrane protease YdiL (CAAX protease family)